MTPTPVTKGDLFDLQIERLTYGGDGLGRHERFAIFVPRAVPGDQVQVKIDTVKRNFARGHAKTWLTKSKDRIEPKCKYFGQCGGCHFQMLPEEQVREIKVSQLQETFIRLGPGELAIQPIIFKDSWNYRNRVTYHREGDAQGYVRWDNYKVLDVEECPIARPALNDLWKKIRESLKNISDVEIPYVVLRETFLGELAVVFSVTNSSVTLPILPTGVSVYKTLIKKDSKSPFGEEMLPIQGYSHIEEKIAGITFSLRPDLFFQIHPQITESLVSYAHKWASKLEGPILDLYCGAGLFSLTLAKTGEKVLGVESHRHSILDAEKSAKNNTLDSQVQFRTGKVETILEKLFREKERFSSAIVDPPRKGLTPKVLEYLAPMGIKNLLYISCSPPTLARDLKELVKLGFQVQEVQPFDMFPQTYHIECAVRLVRN